MLKIKNGRVITPSGIRAVNVYVEKGVISALTNEELPFAEEIDANGSYVSPGFIDTHVHGGMGFDFNEADENGIFKAATAHLKHGTTTLLPTVCSRPMTAIPEIAGEVKRAAARDMMPHIPGLHLEGPYLNASQSGGISPKYLKAPEKEEYVPIFEKCGDFIKKVTFAPELDGAEELFLFLKKSNIIASAGHTDATIDEIARFRDMGLDMVTHLYSSMASITRNQGYRVLGTVEAAYYFEDIYAEVIADGIHLPPRLLELIYRFKGADRICLITDAIRAALLEVNENNRAEIEQNFGMIIEDGIAKMPHRQCFAGSLATADRLIRTMRPIAGLENSVKMLTEIPATAHSIKGKGMLSEGYDADIVIFDEDINIEKIIIKNNNCVKIYN